MAFLFLYDHKTEGCETLCLKNHRLLIILKLIVPDINTLYCFFEFPNEFDAFQISVLDLVISTVINVFDAMDDIFSVLMCCKYEI